MLEILKRKHVVQRFYILYLKAWRQTFENVIGQVNIFRPMKKFTIENTKEALHILSWEKRNLCQHRL